MITGVWYMGHHASVTWPMIFVNYELYHWAEREGSLSRWPFYRHCLPCNLPCWQPPLQSLNPMFIPWMQYLCGSLTKRRIKVLNVPLPTCIRFLPEAPFTDIDELFLGHCMSSKVWDEIIHPFPNFNYAAVQIWKWISSFTLYFLMGVITYPC